MKIEDYKQVFDDMKRICKSVEGCDCSGCPLQLFCMSPEHIDTLSISKAVFNWTKEHPQKTRLQDFKEKYPNAPTLSYADRPGICCKVLGYNEKHCFSNCKACWNKPLEE